MKKLLIIFVLSIFLMSFLVLAETDSDSKTVCCKTYGLGAYMKEVNVQYELINETDCSVPEGFVGGGKKVVEDKFCKDKKADLGKGIDHKLKQINKFNMNKTDCPEDCTCTGSVVKCELSNGRIMTVEAGNSGNTIIQVKGENMSTYVELFKNNETGKIQGVFKNITKSIILPDEAKEKIEAKLQKKINKYNLTLDEDGFYTLKSKQKSKILGRFSRDKNIEVKINAETGEVIKTKTSWWGFLSTEVNETSA